MLPGEGADSARPKFGYVSAPPNSLIRALSVDRMRQMLAHPSSSVMLNPLSAHFHLHIVGWKDYPALVHVELTQIPPSQTLQIGQVNWQRPLHGLIYWSGLMGHLGLLRLSKQVNKVRLLMSKKSLRSKLKAELLLNANNVSQLWRNLTREYEHRHEVMAGALVQFCKPPAHAYPQTESRHYIASVARQSAVQAALSRHNLRQLDGSQEGKVYLQHPDRAILLNHALDTKRLCALLPYPRERAADEEADPSMPIAWFTSDTERNVIERIWRQATNERWDKLLSTLQLEKQADKEVDEFRSDVRLLEQVDASGAAAAAAAASGSGAASATADASSMEDVASTAATAHARRS